MIRAESQQKLLENFVIKRLESLLIPSGFKYLKGSKSFKKTAGRYEQVLYVGLPYDPLEFDGDKEELLLKFHIDASIESPKLEKWVLQNINERCRFSHPVKMINGFVNIDIANLNNEDFFTPSDSRLFKKAVTKALIGNQQTETKTLQEVELQLPEVINQFEDATDDIYLFDNRPPAFRPYLYLLVFTNHLDLAKEHYKITYQNAVHSIESNLINDVNKAKEGIQSLEEFIAEAKLLLDLDLENPFERKIPIKKNAETKVRLAHNLGYVEALRLDLSMIDLRSFDINNKGDIVFLQDEKLIKKINKEGVVVGSWEIHYPDCFKELYNADVRFDEASSSFFINNMVVTDDNELIDLKIDIDVKRLKKNSIYPHVRDLAYDKENGHFFMLFSPDNKSSILSTYNRKGELLGSQALHGNSQKINIAARHVFVSGEGNSFDLLSFKGEFIKNLKYGNANHRIAISTDGNLILLHFYSTKSQFFNLKNNNEEVIWAHPTYVKGYKELFYNDINHNFGLTTACFTPNGQHIIGGADHGKYVVWDTKSLKRQELIPNEASMTIFNWFTTSYFNGISQTNYFKPYTVEHEGYKLFINRGYDMSKIFFVDGGSFIVTGHSDSLLVWNDKFENVGFLYGVGKTAFSSKDFMATKIENDFILFRRVEGFQDNFESSIFKEKEKTDEPITENTPIQTEAAEKENDVVTNENVSENNNAESKPLKNKLLSWLFRK